jgi:AcrR family transcriptional regulator
VKAKKADGYHHGNLRQALLDAALDLITQKGSQGFTLREVARQAGVSHNAPYFHFEDKAALLEALVVNRFEAFTAALRETQARTPGSALDQLQALGMAYIQFAAGNIPAFRLMFRPELIDTPDRASSAAVQNAGQETYAVLVECIIRCQEEGSIPPGDPLVLALTAWSTVHGLVFIIIDSAFLKNANISIEAVPHIAQGVVQTLIHGLKNPPG